jgi:hypothetical protein
MAPHPAAPQAARDVPSSPHPVSPYAPQGVPQAPYDPNTTLKTKQPAGADDGLDKPPKNMMPIYAVIVVVLLVGAALAIYFATQ